MDDGVVLYGIKTCSTVKKAMKWLEEQGVAFRYHDLRKDGVTLDMLKGWIAASGWEALLNRASMTFRRLDEADRQNLDEAKALRLMLEHPTLIRRPVLSAGTEIRAGFKPEVYAGLFGQQH